MSVRVGTELSSISSSRDNVNARRDFDAGNRVAPVGRIYPRGRRRVRLTVEQYRGFVLRLRYDRYVIVEMMPDLHSFRATAI